VRCSAKADGRTLGTALNTLVAELHGALDRSEPIIVSLLLHGLVCLSSNLTAHVFLVVVVMPMNRIFVASSPPFSLASPTYPASDSFLTRVPPGKIESRTRTSNPTPSSWEEKEGEAEAQARDAHWAYNQAVVC
jgi:hypothetical protein